MDFWPIDGKDLTLEWCGGCNWKKKPTEENEKEEKDEGERKETNDNDDNDDNDENDNDDGDEDDDEDDEDEDDEDEGNRGWSGVGEKIINNNKEWKRMWWSRWLFVDSDIGLDLSREENELLLDGIIYGWRIINNNNPFYFGDHASHAHNNLKC